jgi:uncharacterized protein YkwD
MKIRVFGIAVLCCALGLWALFPASRTSQSQTTKGSPSKDLSPLEQDLLTEINQARAHPDTYASYLESMKPFFSGKNYKPAGQDGYKTEEGWSAVEDAIKFLRAAKPQGPLNPSNGLRLAAQAHCTDQARSGTTGHTSGGGLSKSA